MMITQNPQKTTKGKCPTCGAKNVPRGMHCRLCLCDMLGGNPIGTTKKFLADMRKQKRVRPLPFRGMVELYEEAI